MSFPPTDTECTAPCPSLFYSSGHKLPLVVFGDIFLELPS